MKSLSDCVVLVTPRSFGAQAPELRTELEHRVGHVRYNETGHSLSSDELAASLYSVDGLIAGLDEINASVFASASNLRVVARYGVGISNVDLEAARSHHVVVTNTPGANSQAVAELTIAFVFVLSRSVTAADRSVHNRLWKSSYGVEVAGRTVGLVGFGRVGKAVAKSAQALGCRVVAYDPLLAEAPVEGDIEMMGLDQLLNQSDFVSLHAPATRSTRGMVDSGFLARMRPGSFLINTARGELIVESDLIAALDSGHLRGAALDALEEEPPSPDNALLDRQDVILTPHMGAHTVEATVAMGRAAMEDCLAVLSGQPPRYPVISTGEVAHVHA
jgi:D-3-phosphoglycerate dehydrogenase